MSADNNQDATAAESRAHGSAPPITSAAKPARTKHKTRLSPSETTAQEEIIKALWAKIAELDARQEDLWNGHLQVTTKISRRVSVIEVALGGEEKLRRQQGLDIDDRLSVERELEEPLPSEEGLLGEKRMPEVPKATTELKTAPGKWLIRVDTWPDGTETLQLRRPGRVTNVDDEMFEEDGDAGEDGESDQEGSEGGEGGSADEQDGGELDGDAENADAHAGEMDSGDDDDDENQTLGAGEDEDGDRDYTEDEDERPKPDHDTKASRKKRSRDDGDDDDDDNDDDEPPRKRNRTAKNHGRTEGKKSSTVPWNPINKLSASLAPLENEPGPFIMGAEADEDAQSPETVSVAPRPLAHFSEDHERERRAALLKYDKPSGDTRTSTKAHHEPTRSTHRKPQTRPQPPKPPRPANPQLPFAQPKAKRKGPGYDLVPEEDFVPKTMGVDRDPMREAKRSLQEVSASSGRGDDEAGKRRPATRWANKRRADARA